jgi:hypothetical protein
MRVENYMIVTGKIGAIFAATAVTVAAVLASGSDYRKASSPRECLREQSVARVLRQDRVLDRVGNVCQPWNLL